ncbi:MAG TPA: hypothetical protein ENF94_00730 [Candidatus Woesearchaeota archaeon]|nr:MAG: hypothetical protein DRJ25_02270 [Candidatus Woesearchaeota archaeon]HDD70665.1 hypothetical protein [Candidatus Woesearchaeota archaeon]
MERGVKDRSVLDEFITKFCDVLEKHCKYIIVSGFVAIASGRVRGTEDIDIITEKMDRERFLKLHESLIKEGFVCMQSDYPKEIFDDYLSQKTSVRYTLKEKPLPEAELKFAKDELDELQLNTRCKLPLTGLDVWFSSINMNIAFKEEYLKSDKDIEDAKHLRIVYSDLVDEDEINHIKEMIRRLRL